MSKDTSKAEIKRIMTHQNAYVRLGGSNEKDLLKSAKAAKKYLKNK